LRRMLVLRYVTYQEKGAGWSAGPRLRRRLLLQVMQQRSLRFPFAPGDVCLPVGGGIGGGAEDARREWFHRHLPPRVHRGHT